MSKIQLRAVSSIPLVSLQYFETHCVALFHLTYLRYGLHTPVEHDICSDESSTPLIHCQGHVENLNVVLFVCAVSHVVDNRDDLWLKRNVLGSVLTF